MREATINNNSLYHSQGIQILKDDEPLGTEAILRELRDLEKQNKKLIEENAALHKEIAKDKRRLEAYDNME